MKKVIVDLNKIDPVIEVEGSYVVNTNNLYLAIAKLIKENDLNETEFVLVGDSTFDISVTFMCALYPAKIFVTDPILGYIEISEIPLGKATSQFELNIIDSYRKTLYVNLDRNTFSPSDVEKMVLPKVGLENTLNIVGGMPIWLDLRILRTYIPHVRSLLVVVPGSRKVVIQIFNIPEKQKSVVQILSPSLI